MTKARATIATTMAAAMLAMLCACSPHSASDQPASSQTSSSDATASTVAWSPETDCAMCHSAQADSLSDGECLAGFHASMSGADCMSCHADADALGAVHEDANGPCKNKKLKQTEVPEDLCLACHGTYEDLAAKTADYKGTTDSNGTTVNPHAIPEVDGHLGITCTTCHEGHKASVASESCLKCHHANVYECGTCHE